MPTDSRVAQLRAISGDDQQGTAGSLLAQPLIVEAVGRSGHPVAGASIVFTFDGSVDGGGLDPGSVVTDQSGRAGALVRLGRNSGTQTVDARPDPSAGDGLVRFRLTALQADDGDDDPEGGDGDDDDGDDVDDGGNGKGDKGKSKGGGKGKGRDG